MKDRPTIIVIGGGVSGLSAGINGEQNGMHVILLESQPYVGGFCTGWYRKGRYVDGCLHWLTGTNPHNDLYKMWKNVRAIDKDEDIIYLDSFGTFERDGVTVTFHRDINKTEKEWIAISPSDKKEIRHFCNMVRDFVSVELPMSKPASDLGFPSLLKAAGAVLRVWPSYLLTMKISTADYANKFKHPALRYAIKNVQPGAGNLFSMLFSYSTIVGNNGGIPKGGSKALAERMKDRFLDLGGTLRLNTEVDKILVRSKKAYGVRLKNGDVIYGDYVVTAISPEIVTHKLLENKYIKPRFEKRLHNTKNNPTPGCVLMQFEIEDIPNWNIPFNFEVEKLKVGTQYIDSLTLRSYAYDPDTFVRDNKTIVSCLIDQYDEDYYFWEDLYTYNKEAYYRKKNEIGEEVIKRIYQRFPELVNKVTLLDIATPHTMKRYTNSTRGAYMSFLFTKRNTMYTSSGRIPGINNLFLAGQWVASPGGLPFAMLTGYYAIQRICRKANMSYVLSPSYQFKRFGK
ncbi:MAG: NAD(P)/FAD-dependent oxidoreductase [Bacilli bacterium]|nr:NAD(P)/FAD-dependent oxidoreductase [Bacilli bacterium]